MKRLYARLVLWLIGPALRLASRDEPAAKSIGWVIGKRGQLSIIRTPEEIDALNVEVVTMMSESVGRSMQVSADRTAAAKELAPHAQTGQGGALWQMRNGI